MRSPIGCIHCFGGSLRRVAVWILLFIEPCYMLYVIINKCKGLWKFLVNFKEGAEGP